MCHAELEAKFRECAAWGGCRPNAPTVTRQVGQLEQVADVRELTTLLQA
jgi:hypothetical protein